VLKRPCRSTVIPSRGREASADPAIMTAGVAGIRSSGRSPRRWRTARPALAAGARERGLAVGRRRRSPALRR
jgi:hypothetical protein